MYFEIKRGIVQNAVVARNTLSRVSGGTMIFSENGCSVRLTAAESISMTVEDHPTYLGSHPFEVVLKRFLDAVHGNGCDPQGTYTVPSRTTEAEAYTVEITVEPTADGHDQEIRHSYCLDCEWSVSTAEYPKQEVSSRVVRHAVETGHDIDSSYLEVVADDDGTDSSGSG